METGIPAIKHRWYDLKSSYLMNRSPKPWNPAYVVIKKVKDHHDASLPKSIPATNSTLTKISTIAKDLFNKPISYVDHADFLPPWKLLEIPTKFFPLNKSQAVKHPIQTAHIFRSLTSNEHPAVIGVRKKKVRSPG